MLLGLRVRGFKNLRDVGLRFGPLTCLLGPNGVGKSNIFDAVQFLRHLADSEIHEAAERIRRSAEGVFGARDLFWNRDTSRTMEFEASLLLPRTTEDDFGAEAQARSTLVRYRVSFGWHAEEHRLELLEEELTPIRKGDARKVLGFGMADEFVDSAVFNERTGGAYISTLEDRRIQLHQDGGSRGRPVNPGRSPRTVLGGTNTADNPTVLCARREMASWSQLQLEPSSLRTPDRLGERRPVDEFGRHIAATLDRLAQRREDRAGILMEATNRVKRLVPSLQELRLTEDKARDLMYVEAKFIGSDVWLPPRALSDGTLRFLAMTALQMDSDSARVLCIEEPENGIHQDVMGRVVDLLRDYVVDPLERVDPVDNPLRQALANSHSPQLARHLQMAEVLFVEQVTGESGAEARVRAVDHTENWRTDVEDPVTVQLFQQVVGDAPQGQGLLPLDASE